MARDRDSKDLPGASSTSGQSKPGRPPLARTESDNSNTTETHAHKSKRQHHVGRLHARVPSSKTLHNKSNRRAVSPDPAHHQHPHRPTAHRRATSEVKLSRESSSTNLPKNVSQTSLKKNRSYGDVNKGARAAEKLKRLSGGTTTPGHRPKSSKSQVHFDLGSDENEEEGDWVDASASNSPHMSRKGSVNSSAQSSLRPTASANNSRPQTPIEQPTRREPSSPERSRSLQQQYLTSRLLQRTPSSGAPPQMTNDMAHTNPSKSSLDSTGQQTPMTGSSKESPLTSRFVDGPTVGSGGASQGSTIHPSAAIDGRRSEEIPRRPKSMADLSRSDAAALNGNRSPGLPDERDDSALVPRPKRRTGLPAEASRIQQKLNLQRESSDIKTGPPGPVNGGMATPLIGVSGSGYDGANSRDPRVAKLIERADSEYLVVRRYQNPIARSLRRLQHHPDLDKALRIPKGGMAGSIASRRSLQHHSRNVSTPAASRPVTPRTAPGSFQGDGDNTRLSGSSLVGSAEDDGVQALLRGLWEKPMDLSASAD